MSHQMKKRQCGIFVPIFMVMFIFMIMLIVKYVAVCKLGITYLVHLNVFKVAYFQEDNKAIFTNDYCCHQILMFVKSGQIRNMDQNAPLIIITIFSFFKKRAPLVLIFNLKEEPRSLVEIHKILELQAKNQYF